MQPFPHEYTVWANAGPKNDVLVRSAGLPILATAAPAEFDGPGDRWSPETMLMAAAANCLILTFRAVAQAARFPWQELACTATGILDRVERVTRFTEVRLDATLVVAAGSDEARALQLLEKAKSACLLTNSLNATTTLEARVVASDGQCPEDDRVEDAQHHRAENGAQRTVHAKAVHQA